MDNRHCDLNIMLPTGVMNERQTGFAIVSEITGDGVVASEKIPIR